MSSGAAVTTGHLLVALLAAPLLFGAGLLVFPERTLLLRDEIGASPVTRSGAEFRRWRLRGLVFLVVGGMTLYVRFA